MKTEKLQMRISKETKEMLNTLAKHYNLSASAVIDLLIAEKFRSVMIKENITENAVFVEKITNKSK